MMKERLIVLVNQSATSQRTKNKEFGELTGIKKETVRALADGRQKFNEDYIQAITEAFPQYKMWFAFGETYPEIGQLSPDLEETSNNYGKTGTDTE